jgi:hypothetical protein
MVVLRVAWLSHAFQACDGHDVLALDRMSHICAVHATYLSYFVTYHTFLLVMTSIHVMHLLCKRFDYKLHVLHRTHHSCSPPQSASRDTLHCVRYFKKVREITAYCRYKGIAQYVQLRLMIFQKA